ncbi:hypothetical protein [Noviherbaspirillum saxi]|uniref:Uncharacterized protein n=1 Tax=Noviherbaspirillum saxi TaxID=2320863 RepID=A0A3A3FK08_9BURK|nr:hypothetical protein [Noviherbaspirillum saxi]RJF95041.1 hypothetical protein D3871_16370 [Noviherbaspirillum saxi]
MHTTSLIVTDARPLIELADVDELDTLLALAPDIRILIPDMVRHALLVHIDIPGVPDALEWIRANDGQGVSVQCTEEFEEFIVLKRRHNDAVERSQNELAAGEILGRELARGTEAIVLLLGDAHTEHASVLANLPAQVLPMSTTTYLQRLRSQQRQSMVGALLQRVLALGRPTAS